MALSGASTTPVAGGKYALTFSGNGAVIPHEGEYLEIERPHRIVFIWKSEHAGDTLVTLDFTKVSERKTKVTLTHERFAAASARDSHRSG